MNSSNSKQVDTLFRAIVEYFSNISGTDLTQNQMRQRDLILGNLGIICDDSLDGEIIKLQEDLIAAGFKNSPQESSEASRSAVETAINLLAP